MKRRTGPARAPRAAPAARAPSRAPSRAAVLLEAIVGVALFTVFAIAVLASASRALDTARNAREHALAFDVARTALSLVDAGIATPEDVTGPVSSWSVVGGAPDASLTPAWGLALDASPLGSGSAAPADEWTTSVTRQPADAEGLEWLVISAWRGEREATASAEGGSTRPAPRVVTLRQLVRAAGDGAAISAPTGATSGGTSGGASGGAP